MNLKLKSEYIIQEKNNPNKTLVFIDENPTGVTLKIFECDNEISFSLCRTDMIKTLEYVLSRIKK